MFIPDPVVVQRAGGKVEWLKPKSQERVGFSTTICYFFALHDVKTIEKTEQINSKMVTPRMSARWETNCKVDAPASLPRVGSPRFGRTFATNHLHNGANIRQIQKWLGHHSLDVTINYLADEDDTSEPVRDQVNGAFEAFV
jgi:integrase